MLNAGTGVVFKNFATAYGTVGMTEAGLAHVAAFRQSDGTVRCVAICGVRQR